MEQLIDPQDEQTLSDAFLKNLLLNSGQSNGLEDPSKQKSSDGVPYITITPLPGFCMKSRTDGGDKIFINICQSENVPAPADLTDDELLQVLESEDPTQFRIPMSIGEPHAELDKAGSGCTAYDVVVNPGFMTKMNKSELFRTFFLTIMCEGLESKFDILLKRDWVFLKNRKCVGKLGQHNIRTKSKPVIMDMSEDGTDQLPTQQPEKRNLVEEMKQSEDNLMKTAPEPKFNILQEPSEGHPEFLVAEIHLPNIKSVQSLQLDVGEDRLVLTTRSHVYHLDIFLPFLLINEETGAQFDRNTKVLTITMPVQPE